MKILIAIPCMDKVDVDFFESVLALDKSQHECTFTIVSNTLIYDARERLTLRALESGCDAVLWLDSDMVFPIDMINRMVEQDKDIISGLYFTRRLPIKPVAYEKLGYNINKTVDCKSLEPIPKKTTEVQGIGFGCCLMKTKVLKDVTDKFHAAFSPMPGLGEDLSFCMRARDCGYEIYLDPTIVCGHVGRMIINKDTYLAYKKS